MRRLKGAFTAGAGVALVVIVGLAGIAATAGIIIMAFKPLISYWTSSSDSTPKSNIAARIIMYDSSGNKFAEVWSSNRNPVSSLDDVSMTMQNAIISAEDKNFYDHGAVDVIATIRSVMTSSGGGSGITQQLIKNMQYLSYNATADDKSSATATTIARKLKEMKIAMNYERTHTKRQILLKYLNTVSIGSSNVYGIETASQEIFGKSAKDLNISEAAALAGSVNNTSVYNLLRMDDKDTAKLVKERQTYVLDRMLANGYITQKEHDDAVKAPITTNIQNETGGCGSSEYPFYCQYVIDYMLKDERLGSTVEERQARISQGGFSIYTYLDETLLKQADAQVRADLGVTNRVAMPMAFVQPGTGGVTAIASNRNWGTDESKGETEIPLANSGTQTGSTYKMITLATALANGWTEDMLNNVDGYCPWTKAGYDTPPGGINDSISCAVQGGVIGYKKATALSSNTYYAELSTEVGIDKLISMSKTLGLTVSSNITPRSASFTLGVESDSPIQMAAAYATFSAKGVYCPATPVKSYTMLDGTKFRAADTYDPSSGGCKSILTKKQASIVLKAQNSVVNDTSIPNRLGSDAAMTSHQVVGKSGTTNDLANSSWAATVGQYTVYANTYDPRGNYQYPLTYYLYRGQGVDGYYNAALKTVKSILETNLADKPNVALDLNDTDNSYVKVNNTESSMNTVPNVNGMSARAALTTMRNAGINARILISSTNDDSGSGLASYSNGTVVRQSIAAGTKLSTGTTKIVEITIVRKGESE